MTYSSIKNDIKTVFIRSLKKESTVIIMNYNSFIVKLEQSIKKNWDKEAFTDYKGLTLQYKDVARKIAKYHIAFKECGINKGDKIAICGRNSSQWAVTFLAIESYGAVAVPVLHEFKTDNIHNIVKHSDAKLLFVGNMVWENLNEKDMPNLQGIISLENFTLLISRNQALTYCLDHLNEMYGHKYPRNFRKEHVIYDKEDSESLAIINYTSGTTGYSKGVMLPYRSLSSNIENCENMIHFAPGDNIVSMLPMGHVFGMTYDFLYGFTAGAHIYFLTRMPSPKVIAQSFPEIRPRMICSVPLIIEKIIKKDILPKLDNKLSKLLLHVPVIKNRLKAKARQEAKDAFGGNFDEILIGGAPLNPELEAFLRMIDFPYAIVYGMTEVGPTIATERWENIKYKSCGKVAVNMEIKILSDNPKEIPGELICRGNNLMLGYYKNPDATAQVIDKEGWLHTGDIATIDEDGAIIIKGRIKNMLIKSSGQNIYPEEIEARLNNMPYISESLIVMQKSHLVALVYPDFEDAFAHNMTNDDIETVIEMNKTAINKVLPTFSQITKIKIYPEEFEKTAKKSIKRFLYQAVEN